ncbi:MULTISPECIES: GDYXXLXY domain-containing protein [unclassified Psychrobacter]|uniref:GDYXXLXY domain-containing protein n=1 Tax=unclassified Psychrobacter TaxID=196806 RepID=UPI000760F1B7|nr:GDYXXLXY domain-containing protein [Psychrobacter sp. P11F6]
MKNKILTKRLIDDTSPSTHWLKKRAVTITIALLGLALILVVMTLNIIKYENHLSNGKTVLLALAPVDPRGFMQGDYMALSYALEGDFLAALRAKKLQEYLGSFKNSENLQPAFHPYQPSQGYVIVKIDGNNVGHFVRLADSNSREELTKSELPIYYRIRNGSVQLATNAFFFQEGHAEAFEAAEYGLFRVNDKGEPLLTEMVDGDFTVIVGDISEKDKASQ